MTAKTMTLSECLCFFTGKSFRTMLSCYRPHLLSYGLTVSQLFVLLALYETDNITHNDLLKKLVLDASTLTGILGRLEKMDLVKRSVKPGDRRSVVISLTEKARSMEEKLWGIYEKVNGGLLKVLSREEIETLKDLLARLESHARLMSQGM